MLDLRGSYIYQKILKEGIAEGGNGTARLHFEIGARCMGMPDTDPQEKLRAILSLEELDCLINRLLDVESGEDLLR